MRAPVKYRFVALAVSCLTWLLAVPPVFAQQHRVLTLLATRQDAPPSIVYDDVIRSVMTEDLGGTLEYYSEYLDVERFSDEEYVVALRGFLQRKYSGQDFDVVIAPTKGTLDFIRAHRDELFPRVPVVFSTFHGDGAAANATGVTYALDMAATIDFVRQLQPGITQVYVLSGTSPNDTFYLDIARAQLRSKENGLSIVYWSDLPLREALQRVAQLPPDAIVYALPFNQDASGQRFSSIRALRAITSAASVPVYHFSELVLGDGVVGGVLHSTEAVAAELARLSLRILHGERAEAIPVVELDTYRPTVDWRQLQRWGISEARLPTGTTIRFREPGVWERYRFYIVGTSALLLLQTTLIAGLLIQRRRRRRTEESLRVSYQRNQDLAGRLITAQEMERRRIAREIHDDASQQVASLAISLSVLKARASRAGADVALAEALAEMQQRTIALGENLRTLSHDLHPAVLQHDGIVAALRSHSTEFARMHGIATRFEATEDIGDLDIETSLCLYRVAQEALANSARHSRANDVVVKLVRVNGCVQLSVADNGAGFDRSQPMRSGLGLQSIDERARLKNGTATIVSNPGRGTLVSVSLPVVEHDGAAAAEL
jgi:signal transduction histidine kinase